MPKLDVAQTIWDESRPFKQSVRSYFYMLAHPRRCLRMLNFAIKMCLYFEVDIEKELK